MREIPSRCVIHGEGVAVWDAHLPQEPTVRMARSDDELLTTDAPTYETVTLYRPVTVDVVDDEAVAYYYRSEAARRLDRRGKVYVDPKYVHMRPPTTAHRARRFGCEGPSDRIEPGDVPDEYREGES